MVSCVSNGSSSLSLRGSLSANQILLLLNTKVYFTNLLLINRDQLSALAEICSLPVGGFWIFYLGHPPMSTDTLDVYRALGRRTCVEYNPLGATLGTSLDVHCRLSYLSSAR